MARRWKEIAQTGSTSFLGLLFQALALILTTRFLGPEGRGIFAASCSWIIFLATLLCLSLGQVILHHSIGKDRAWTKRAVGSALSSILLLHCVFVLALYILKSNFNIALFDNIPNESVLLLLLALPFFACFDTTRYSLLSLDSLKAANISQALGYILGGTTLVLTLLYYKGLSPESSLFAILICYASTFLGSLYFLFDKLKGLSVSFSMGKRLLFSSFKLHWNAIGVILFSHLDVIVINHFLTAKDTAFYQLADQLIHVLILLAAAASTVCYTIVQSKGPDAGWLEQRKIIFQVLALILPLAALSYFLAPYAISILAGDEFLPAVVPFRILLIAVLGMSISQLMASQWIARGLFWQTAAITLLSGTLNLLGNIAVIPRWGIVGVAWVTSSIFIVSVFINGVLFHIANKRACLLNLEK